MSENKTKETIYWINNDIAFNSYEEMMEQAEMYQEHVALHIRWGIFVKKPSF